MYQKGDNVAILSDEGSFYLARVRKDVLLPNQSVSIQWYEEYKESYILGGLDNVGTDVILASGINVVPMGKSASGKQKYDLTYPSWKVIKSSLDDAMTLSKSHKHFVGVHKRSKLSIEDETPHPGSSVAANAVIFSSADVQRRTMDTSSKETLAKTIGTKEAGEGEDAITAGKRLNVSLPLCIADDRREKRISKKDDTAFSGSSGPDFATDVRRVEVEFNEEEKTQFMCTPARIIKGEISVGNVVSARWTDGKVYPATVIRIEYEEQKRQRRTADTSSKETLAKTIGTKEAGEGEDAITAGKRLNVSLPLCIADDRREKRISKKDDTAFSGSSGPDFATDVRRVEVEFNEEEKTLFMCTPARIIKGEISVGNVVSARWTDGKVYPATVIRIEYEEQKRQRRTANTLKIVEPIVFDPSSSSSPKTNCLKHFSNGSSMKACDEGRTVSSQVSCLGENGCISKGSDVLDLECDDASFLEKHLENGIENIDTECCADSTTELGLSSRFEHLHNSVQSEVSAIYDKNLGIKPLDVPGENDQSSHIRSDQGGDHSYLHNNDQSSQINKTQLGDHSFKSSKGGSDDDYEREDCGRDDQSSLINKSQGGAQNLERSGMYDRNLRTKSLKVARKGNPQSTYQEASDNSSVFDDDTGDPSFKPLKDGSDDDYESEDCGRDDQSSLINMSQGGAQNLERSGMYDRNLRTKSLKVARKGDPQSTYQEASDNSSVFDDDTGDPSFKPLKDGSDDDYESEDCGRDDQSSLINKSQGGAQNLERSGMYDRNLRTKSLKVARKGDPQSTYQEASDNSSVFDDDTGDPSFKPLKDGSDDDYESEDCGRDDQSSLINMSQGGAQNLERSGMYDRNLRTKSLKVARKGDPQSTYQEASDNSSVFDDDTGDPSFKPLKDGSDDDYESEDCGSDDQSSLINKSQGRARKLESSVNERPHSDTSNDETAPSKKNLRGIFQKDRTHFCFYCKEEQPNLWRHLTLKHPEEIDVEKAMAVEKGSAERERLFKKLMRLGDHNHNIMVYLFGGDYVLVRKPPKDKMIINVSKEDYGPCLHCFGWFVVNSLWQHSPHCPGKEVLSEEENPNKKVLHKTPSLAYLALSNATENRFELDEDFKAEVIEIMRDVDKKTLEVILKDSLIMRLGFGLYEKQGFNTRNVDRQVMRILGRLVVQLREDLQSPTLSLLEVIMENDMDAVTGAARKLAAYNRSEKSYKKACTAENCGHAYKKAVMEVYVMYLSPKTKDIVKAQEIYLVMQSLDEIWSRKINIAARRDRLQRQMNNPKLVPLTSDLIKLSTRLANIVRDCRNQFKKDSNNIDSYSWGRFMRAVMVQVLLFNKKRSAEPASIKITDLVNPPDWDTESSQESLASLSPMERDLKDKMSLIMVPGKRWQKPVPVMLKPSMRDDMLLVIETGKRFVAKNNPYVFAARKKSKSSIRGHDALKEFVDEMATELDRPESIKGTSLRKYFATVIQVLSLEDREIDWIAKFLGHDIRVHRKYYRQTDSVIYTTKIAKLLMAVDEGKTQVYNGKTLADIQIDEDFYGEDEHLEDADSNSNLKSTVENTDNKKQSFTDNRFQKKRASTNGDSDYRDEMKSRTLTDDEKKYVSDYFKVQITTEKLKVPGREDCCKLIQSNDSIKKKVGLESWRVIKDIVHNRKVSYERMKHRIGQNKSVFQGSKVHKRKKKFTNKTL